MASRISWSSAPRLAGFEMRIRATLSAGSSTRSLPDASSRLLKHHQRVALRDRLALLAADLRDRPVVLGLHRHLHLHRLEDEERVALHDLLSDFALDLPDGPGDVSLYVGQLLLLCSRGRSGWGTIPGRVRGNWNRRDRSERGRPAARDARRAGRSVSGSGRGGGRRRLAR